MHKLRKLGKKMIKVTDKILHMLEEHDIKPSYQRMQVLEYLMNDDTHPTAEVIFTNIHSKSPVISKATVYNTLNLFVEKGLISTMKADKLELRYDIVTDEHGHFVCKSCGKVYNFEHEYKNEYVGLDGFDIENEEIVLKGICKVCNKNK